MLREPYISDNPFRLLGLSAGESAFALGQGVSVGRAGEVPLEKQFGADTEHLGSCVGSLESDHLRATIYRIFWLDDLGDLPNLVEACESPKLIEASGHLGFLASWYSFLLYRRPVDLRTSIDWLKDLSKDEEFVQRLLRPLRSDGVDDVIACAEVDRAIEAVVTFVGMRVYHLACEEFGNREFSVAERFIELAQELTVAEEAIDHALRPIIEFGDVLERELDEEPIPHGFQLTKQSPRCDALEDLVSVIGQHPRAMRWARAALQHRTRSAASVRDGAQQVVVERGDIPMALFLLDRALWLRPSEDLAVTLAKDIQTLTERMNAANEAVWKEVGPSGPVPILKTFCGWGFQALEAGRFAGGPDMVFAIRFFTAFGLPIIPTARYVGRFNSGQFSCSGRTAWTPGMKLWLGAMIATLVWVILYGFMMLR